MDPDPIQMLIRILLFSSLTFKTPEALTSVDPDPEGPKTCGSGYGSGTLSLTNLAGYSVQVSSNIGT